MLATTVRKRLRVNNPTTKEVSVARNATERPEDVVSLLESTSAVMIEDRIATGTNESQLRKIIGK
jgi:hypothetical protein